MSVVSYVPPYTPPPVTLPVPNAYDDFVAAAALVREPTDLYPVSGSIPTQALRQCAVDNRAAHVRLQAGFRHAYLVPPRYEASGPSRTGAAFRSMARVLCAEGLFRERRGRWMDAVHCYLDDVRLGATLPRGGSFIHWLTGDAIQVIGLRALQRSTDHQDAPSARYAARELLHIQKGGVTYPDALLAATEWECVARTGYLRKVRSLKEYSQLFMWPPGGGTPSLADLGAPVQYFLTPKAGIVRGFRAYERRMAEIERQPYYRRPLPPPRPNDPYSRMYLPVYDQAAFPGVREEALLRVIAVELAARAYTLEHGALPASAQALVPRYLDQVPDDPFAPRPITLKIKSGKALVYSVGPDGADDGGKAIADKAYPMSKGDLLAVCVRK